MFSNYLLHSQCNHWFHIPPNRNLEKDQVIPAFIMYYYVFIVNDYNIKCLSEPTQIFYHGVKWWRKNGDATGLKHRVNGPAIVHPNGDYEWIVDGRQHRDDGPATYHTNQTIFYYRDKSFVPYGATQPVSIDISQTWYQHGQMHRIGGPARIDRDGYEWYQIIDGRSKLHRTDGPAVDKSYMREWRINGELHREDGPAKLYTSNPLHQEWFRHGMRHRVGGPAYVTNSGVKYWYQVVAGQTYFQLIRENDEATCEYPNGMKLWMTKRGYLHRENGPAYVNTATGEERWYYHNVLHREGGPAVTRRDGQQFWYQGGVLHREDGPAIICAVNLFHVNHPNYERYMRHNPRYKKYFYQPIGKTNGARRKLVLSIHQYVYYVNGCALRALVR